MSKVFELSVILAFVLCLMGPARSAEIRDKAELFYIPIGVETYVPITKSNIEEACFGYSQVGLKNNHLRHALRIIANASKASRSLDDIIVRVKIVLPDGEKIYVDNEGVADYSGAFYQLDDMQKDRLNHLMSKVTQRQFRQLDDYLRALDSSRCKM